MSKIVIIEDSQPLISLLTKKFILEGHDCEFILQTGNLSRENIIDDVISKDPNLIILDLNMPGTGGIAVLEELRHRENSTGRSEIPVIILTALDADAEDVGYLKEIARVTEFVQKPIRDIKAFLTLVGTIVSNASGT